VQVLGGTTKGERTRKRWFRQPWGGKRGGPILGRRVEKPSNASYGNCAKLKGKSWALLGMKVRHIPTCIEGGKEGGSDTNGGRGNKEIGF